MNDRPKILFVCSQNKWRSLTAERIFEGDLRYDIRSTGTDQGARIRITPGHIGWADIIFVMETKHSQLIKRKFGDLVDGKRVICLHISDDYQYMDRKLVELLKECL